MTIDVREVMRAEPSAEVELCENTVSFHPPLVRSKTSLKHRIDSGGTEDGVNVSEHHKYIDTTRAPCPRFSPKFGKPRAGIGTLLRGKGWGV